MTCVPTDAYSLPLSFMARYLPEKSPFMATIPTSTAVISMIPAIQINNNNYYIASTRNDMEGFFNTNHTL